VPVVILLAAAVILGGVVVVAMGRGGELERSPRELASRLDFRTWSDVARYRPPAALLGYHAAATEHALAVIARTIAERDAEIDWLRRRLAQTDPQLRSPVVAASAEGNAGPPAVGSADVRARGASGEGSPGEDDGTAQRPGASGWHEFLASPTESTAEESTAEESTAEESTAEESTAEESTAEDVTPADDDAAAADVAGVVSATASPSDTAGGSDAAGTSDTAVVTDAAKADAAAIVSDAAEAGGADEAGSLAVANGTVPEPQHMGNVAAGAFSAAGVADGSPRDEGE